jgi:hypothetical protein
VLDRAVCRLCCGGARGLGPCRKPVQPGDSRRDPRPLRAGARAARGCAVPDAAGSAGFPGAVLAAGQPRHRAAPDGRGGRRTRADRIHAGDPDAAGAGLGAGGPDPEQSRRAGQEPRRPGRRRAALPARPGDPGGAGCAAAERGPACSATWPTSRWSGWIPMRRWPCTAMCWRWSSRSHPAIATWSPRAWRWARPNCCAAELDEAESHLEAARSLQEAIGTEAPIYAGDSRGAGPAGPRARPASTAAREQPGPGPGAPPAARPRRIGCGLGPAGAGRAGPRPGRASTPLAIGSESPAIEMAAERCPRQPGRSPRPS